MMVSTTFSLAVALATVTQASPPPEAGAKLREQLVSVARECLMQKEKPNRVAQGAWLAAEHRLIETKDLLRDRLRQKKTQSQEWNMATRAVLDAMIQNRVSLPLDLVKPLTEERFVAEALILLSVAKGSRKNTLLTLFRDIQRLENPPADAWHAAGNLLARLADAPFATTLLRDLSVDRWIQVSEGGNRRLVSSGGGIESFLWTRMAGFPPPVFYPLNRTPEPGDVLLAPGTNPVFYRRVVVRWRRFYRAEGTGIQTNRNAARLQWLYQLVDGSKLTTKLIARESHAVKLADYAKSSKQIRDHCIESHSALVSALRKRDLAWRRIPKLEIRWHIRDYRTNKKTPLMTFPWMKQAKITIIRNDR